MRGLQSGTVADGHGAVYAELYHEENPADPNTLKENSK
jgi:hypothetical protein